ncbi:MAG: DUF116 domain-containing protein [Planctomycetales bacterium]|nr:DUF116 domain-containing protein [Planctomycetales bacterium]
MATAPTQEPSALPSPRPRRRDTSRFKDVPQARAVRESLRRRCREVAGQLDKSHPLCRDQMEQVARRLLQDADHPEGYLGWTMVHLSSAFWQEQVAAVPYSRRLLLLPHCLKHAEGCPADYDEFGLDCRKCGACSIADFRVRAEDLGYRVLVAEGSPIVMKIIVGGYIDAIVGVACLNVLEKAIDKILLAGIPCMAVPLLSSDCRNTSVDEDWVAEMVELEHRPPTTQTRSYVHLMRAASGLFVPDQLARLAPRLRSPSQAEVRSEDLAQLDPVAVTEAIAYDFLRKGGKYSRPFITLAVYDALTGAEATLADGDQRCGQFSDAVRRTAVSIETFHKASLVHDDIEDNDLYRYGEETLHRQFGIPTAINVGDYLIGLGYRLVSRETAALGDAAVADILDTLADAHLRLSEGQGAELQWQPARMGDLQPLDALKIYALKTAPAFEAAILAGIRLAGDSGQHRPLVAQFARQLGVAFQILNDLKDWHADDNKRVAAGDVLAGRPTLLLALALQALGAAERDELLRLIGDERAEVSAVARVRQLYEAAEVFEKAERLVDKYQDRAEAVAQQLEPEALQRLFLYLIDTVLDRSQAPAPAAQVVDLALPS